MTDLLRFELAEPRVALMAGAVAEVARRVSFSLGTNGGVRKPVQVGAFTEAVRAPGRYWLLINRTSHRVVVQP